MDVARARTRMTARLRWLGDELKMGPAQRKRLTDLFELELWAGTARGVEPFPSTPNLSRAVPRTAVVKITRGEIEDRKGLFSDSPLSALAGVKAKEEEQEGGGRGGGRGGKGEAEGEPETPPRPDPGIPPGLSPAAAAALTRFRAEEVEIVVRTTHPMLADLTVSTLDGVIPLLEIAQVAPYLELLGDEGLFLVRAHAAHRISGYSKLDQGVARIPPAATKGWSVAKRRKSGRGGRGGGGRNGNGNGQRNRR